MTLDVAAHVSASVVPHVLDVIAQRHTTAILRMLLRGPCGFDALVHGLGISRSTLTARLAHLAREGCVTRVGRAHALTPMGRGLFGVLCVMSEWDQAKTGLTHTHCRAPLSLVVACATCSQHVHARDILLPDRPSAAAITPTQTRTRGLARNEVTVLDAEAVLSDKWTARIVALAFYGVTRFAEMETLLAIAPNVLTERLDRLVEHGVLARRLYEERPPRSDYVLTPRGHGLFALVLAMIDWGSTMYRPRAPIDFVHRRCGAPLEIAYRCKACGARVREGDFVPMP